MALDRIVICMFGVPIAGIARLRTMSARQLVHGDRELVGLARFDHEFAPVSLADRARNGGAEVTVAQAIENDLANLVQRLAKLRAAGGLGGCVAGFFKHCAAAPSCP